MMKGSINRYSGASALAIALAAGIVPAVAQAQTADRVPPPAGDAAATDGTVGDEIVVTGLRAALESSLAIKRDADQFVDSITAQDIGRLPDVNVAEALQRVSGVQITRTRGEGSAIAVRGLTQVRTELNGRDIFQASGGRGLSWDEVGSELLAGVDVFKNPAANMIEGGLSGTVNLRTRRPFDQDGQLISALVGYTRYDLIDDDGIQASGLYSNRWDTGIGEVGVLANIGYQTTSFREDEVVVEPFYQHGPTAPGVQGPVPGFADRTVLLPHGGGFAVTYGDRERISGTVALQWRPVPEVEIYTQFFQANYTFNEAGVSFFAAGADVGPSAGRDFTVDENGIVRSGYLANPVVDSVNYATLRDTKTTDFSAGARWDVTDNLQLSVDYQRIDSTVNQNTMNLTASALNPRTSVPGLGQDYDLFFDISDKIPVFQSSVPGYFSDINNYGMTAILPYGENNDATSDAVRGDLTWDFDDSFITNLRAGVRHTSQSAINRNTTYGTWTAIGQSCANWSAECVQLADFPQYAELNRFQPDLLRGDAADTVFGPVWQFSDDLVRNPQAAFDAIRQINGQEVGFRPYDAPNAFLGTIDEKTYAAYARLDYGSTLGGLEFDGNVGVRVVRTETAALGRRVLSYRAPGAAPGTPNVTEDEPFNGGREFTKWLPSANLRVFLTDELILRAAASKNFARPSFTQLNPQFNLGVSYLDAASILPSLLDPTQAYNADTNPYVGTGDALGDPNLLPEEATSYDLALEYYFSASGFVYATAFYKDLKNLIVQRPTAPVRQDIDGIGTVQFNVQRFVNQAEGYVRGFEIGGQAFATFLPAPFDGLGLQANYTLADSDAGQSAAGDINSVEQISVPLNNLSKHSFNLVGLYSKGGLDLRLAYNWRDDFLQGTANTGTQNLPIFGKSYGVLDASISYDLTENLALTLDAQNLLDTAFQTYQIFDNRPRDYQINDRRFSARAILRF
ncbi:TonB-dependent receptor [Croceibacterium ferulae]|uniref:TonB-dependent receptor n=1 Tax=Croceibacterium ferulae TaxID=1854641 RepID=UPI000EB3522F|nr:TonB-dependent receptor [Croceibacterium ferulae]